MVKRLGRNLAAAVALLALAAWCGAVDFSADTVTKMGKMTRTGKIYRQGKKFRQDISSGGMKRTVIMRPDKKVVWILNPAAKTYMEMPQRPGADASNPYDPEKLKKFGTVKNLGTEKIGGFECDKMLFTPKQKQMGTSTTWIAKELKWPLKTVAKSPRGTVTTETKNIKTGSVPSSLFELPKGYKKEAMPKMPQGHGMMPKSMPGRPMPRQMPAPPK